jgi:hypothetical protein
MNFDYIQQELDYYKKFRPANFVEEKARFFAHIKKNEPYNPFFNYSDNLKVKDYKEIKEALQKEIGSDLIINEFLKVHLDVADMLIAWKQNDYEVLSKISGKIFGSTNTFDINKTIENYKQLSSLADEPAEVYNDEQIGEKFKEEFTKRKLDGWLIEYHEASGGNVSIYESEKKIVIRTGTTETKQELECVLAHELDGHAVQAFNAMSNKRYAKWLLSYLGTEKQYEGYATFVVINNLSIAHINSELAYNFALIIATLQAQSSSFYETYQRIYELCRDEDLSFSAAYKAKRGFQDTARFGCFQKENAYSLGALEIIALVEQSEENYYRLLQGCFPLSAVRFIAGKAPKWQSVKNFNKENQAYFKKKMNRILYYFPPQGVSQTVSPPR